MAAAWKFLDKLLMHLTKNYAFSMQNTKLLENCFRNNLQQTIFFESQDILVVLKNCSLKHTKNRDSLNIHTYQTFPPRQDVQSSTLFQQCERQKMRNVP